MAITQQVKTLYQKVTADSVSCGTIAVYAAALGLFLGMMQFFLNHKLL